MTVAADGRLVGPVLMERTTLYTRFAPAGPARCREFEGARLKCAAKAPITLNGSDPITGVIATRL